MNLQKFNLYAQMCGFFFFLIYSFIFISKLKETYPTVGLVPTGDAIQVVAYLYFTWFCYNNVNKSLNKP
jgi:hypothetical protein